MPSFVLGITYENTTHAWCAISVLLGVEDLKAEGIARAPKDIFRDSGLYKK